MGDHTLVAIEVTNKVTGVVTSDFIENGRLTAFLKKMQADYNNGVLDVTIVVDLSSSESLQNDEVEVLASYPFVTLQ
tara:strand:+ start:1568 stop:1798 length:231 start_codon:yes stop_codon:yes gene_type:complete